MKQDLFAETRTPGAPGDLTEHVLRAAPVAAHEPAGAAPTGQRVNRFVLAWVTALLPLLLCHALLSFPRRASPVVPAGSQAGTERKELEKGLGLKGVPMVVAGRDAGRNNDVEKQVMKELDRL
jgi:hypothetical protein